MSEQNPYAAPTATVLDVEAPTERNDIDSLPVSDSWKRRFRLIEKAGGLKMPNHKALSFGERFRLGINFLAFFFTIIYYITKGMWKKGLVLFVLGYVLLAVLSFLAGLAGLERVDNALSIGFCAMFGARANIDYYKKMVLKQNGWW